MSKRFSKPELFGESVKTELGLSNYERREDLKKAIRGDTSDFAKMADLSRLKSHVDEIDVLKLKKGVNVLNSLKSRMNK